MQAGGYQPSRDAQVHADVYWQSAAGRQKLGSIDAMDSPDAGANALGGSFSAAAVPAQCGDQLILHLSFVGGSSSFIEFAVSMDLP